jgi:Kef-type K+ transport system membrane component KefB
MKKLIKYFVGGAVAGAICMFFIKLYFGTEWRSDDIQTIITFGFIGLLFLLPPFKKEK